MREQRHLSDYLPASLPLISTIEVVVLRGLNPSRVSEYMQAAATCPFITVSGAAADRIAELWRCLPQGNQARCHTPPFGLRFYSGEQVICQASVCWECNNIFGDFSGKPLHYEFDAEATPSKQLFAEIQKVVGDAPKH
jgi:hypothetical protein